MEAREQYIITMGLTVRKWPAEKLAREYATAKATALKVHTDHIKWRLEAIEQEVQRRQGQNRSLKHKGGYNAK